MGGVVKLERPNREGLFRKPKKETDWVFVVSVFTLNGLRKIFSSIQGTFVLLDKKRVIYIIPYIGHETGVYNICVRLFGKIEKEEAEAFLKKAGVL